MDPTRWLFANFEILTILKMWISTFFPWNIGQITIHGSQLYSYTNGCNGYVSSTCNMYDALSNVPLYNIGVLFLPSNIIFKIQSCDVDIIRTFKIYYHCYINGEIINQIENDITNLAHQYTQKNVHGTSCIGKSEIFHNRKLLQPL